jgi:hypothetical protein
MRGRFFLQGHRSDRRVVARILLLLLPLLVLAESTRAQDIYMYPAKRQDQAKQDRDRYEYHSWAVKQTEFDPSRPQTAASDTHAVPNQPLPPQGHIARGAARGAALGAVGSAITGDAGTGAPPARRWGTGWRNAPATNKGSSRISSNRPLLIKPASRVLDISTKTR